MSSAIIIPGSKSYTIRALFIAALSGSRVKIINPLICDDTQTMIDCLRVLGVKILEGKDYFEVSGNLFNIPKILYNLNANLSGISLRFLLALSTVIPGTKIISGKNGLNKRPVADLVYGLIQLGAKIEYLDKIGYPPVKVTSSSLQSGTIKIKGSVSSQYISAILIVAPLAGDVTINVTGIQISTPYIDMTIDIMEKFGIKVKNNNYKSYSISANQKYTAKQYLVEGDLSSASYFLAIAVLTKSKITLKNISLDSKQADIKFVKILEKMGNKIVPGKNQITIIGKDIKSLNVDMTNCPDQVQTLAVLSSFAKGVTKISGIQSLRIKETDRVLALTSELKKMGIKTSANRNTLTIHGGSPKPAQIETYGDHRMAMAFAIACCKIPDTEIKNPEVVSKTYPQFWEDLKKLQK